MSGKERAWAEYWGEQAARGGGCATGAPGITAACAHAWRAFAQELASDAAVLDLATGNGAVLDNIRAVRPRASLIGVDSAAELGPGASADQTRLMPGVAMERLPFEAASFDAVTSQFGFEYGDRGAIVGEITRVLRAGGAVRLLMHHRDSPVVAQGSVRTAELRWALSEAAPLAQAINLAVARALAPLPIPASLASAPGAAARQFGAGSAAAEIMTAMLQMLELGGARAPALLRQLRARVAGELARLDALAEAALGRAEVDEVRASFERAGIAVTAVTEVGEAPAGKLFGWLLDGRRG